MVRKDDKHSPTNLKQNKIEKVDTYYGKKSNLIITSKSSYHLKFNLFSRPSEASLLAQWFLSRNIWETLNSISLYIFIHFLHLPLKDQGMRLNKLNAWQSREESHSSQIRLKPLLQAGSIAKMAPITSTYKNFCTPRKEEKLLIYSPLLPRKIPAHAKKPGHPLAAPSVLTLTQLIWENSQIIWIGEISFRWLVETHYACVS